jgi:hypothetical protein
MLAPTMPTKSITYISATTRGRVSAGAKSVASARPAVCVVCKPAPTKRNARAAEARPAHSWIGVSPDSKINANGMMASPPNCISVPNQMKGTRFQPRKLRCVSDFQPTSARKGATSRGSATIRDTSQAPTPSSTIITRLSVPTIKAVAMPTETWNSDKRSSRDSDRSALAASAKGR